MNGRDNGANGFTRLGEVYYRTAGAAGLQRPSQKVSTKALADDRPGARSIPSRMSRASRDAVESERWIARESTSDPCSRPAQMFKKAGPGPDADRSMADRRGCVT